MIVYMIDCAVSSFLPTSVGTACQLVPVGSCVAPSTASQCPSSRFVAGDKAYASLSQDSEMRPRYTFTGSSKLPPVVSANGTGPATGLSVAAGSTDSSGSVQHRLIIRTSQDRYSPRSSRASSVEVMRGDLAAPLLPNAHAPVDAEQEPHS